MQFSFLVTLVATCALASAQDWEPIFTSIKSDEVWKIGETKTVTWNVTDAPAHLKDTPGTLWLRGPSDATFVELADGFDILSGRQTITVPGKTSDGEILKTESGYCVTLFGTGVGADSPEVKLE